ncbi:hypothetical protein TNIN_403641 [Trichonephila inaurata madagascariensis]|uniref:Uncharacterized protein n=1 Tax=Trichonephila inaurata madagascariensis TaxID=2747483 RepID=A0A8X7CEA2_9ARAC|nr:hypothetical protein TNIN_403641 [Trichonephila inaurata madagascariensis]
MPLKTWLRVSDVYSDSDIESLNEESPPTCLFKPPNHQQKHAIRLMSDMDEDWEIRVQFLTTIDGKGFTKIVNDKANVQFEDIIARLKA